MTTTREELIDRLLALPAELKAAEAVLIGERIALREAEARLADEEAVEPVQISKNIAQQGTPVPIVTVFTVHADRRLVVEFVSAVMAIPPPQQATELDIQTVVQGTTNRNHFPFQNEGPQAIALGQNVGVAAHQTRIYADPGSNVQALAFPSVGDSFTDLTLSGYLARVP